MRRIFYENFSFFVVSKLTRFHGMEIAYIWCRIKNVSVLTPQAKSGERMNRVLRLLVVGLMVTWSLSAFAQEEADEEADISASADDETEEAEEDSKDWAVSARLATGIGQGTFVNVAPDPEYDGIVEDPSNAYDRWNMSLSLTPSYTVMDLVSVSATVAWTQQMLAGGGINEPNELRFQDVGLDISWVGHKFESIPISVDAGASLAFPTIDQSQTATLSVGTSLNGGVSYKLFDKLTLRYDLGLGKDFHEYTSPVVTDDVAGIDNLIWRAGGSERVSGGLLLEGVNSEYALSNSFSASLPVWDKLRFSVSYAFSTYWTYDVVKKDELSNEITQDGRDVAQGVSSSVSLSYPFLDYFTGSVALRTSTQPKTSDNRSFNFPFWNVDGAASNSSQLQFAVRAAY